MNRLSLPALLLGVVALVSGCGKHTGMWVNEPGRAPDPTQWADNDRDGMADAVDECPETPTEAEVDAQGCALDGDGDGVPDFRDSCPDTPEGQAVTAEGCAFSDEHFGELGGVHFAYDSARLMPEAKPILERIAEELKGLGGRNRIRVEGHTDSHGPAAYNRELAKRRAQAVIDFLSEQGVPRDWMSAVGVGEAQPVATNESADGRQKNRRVVILPGRE